MLSACSLALPLVSQSPIGTAPETMQDLHLVQFAEPDEYDGPWKGRWSFEQLPMVPQSWKMRTHKRTRDQFTHIKKLINDPKTSEVVCATDAGREGEHIFRLIYSHARCKKPVRRLWISSLTDGANKRGFADL